MNQKEKQENERRIGFITRMSFINCILLVLLMAFTLNIALNIKGENYEYYTKLYELNNTNDFLYNVHDYVCDDNVKVSDYSDNSIFVSTWHGDDTELGKRYGECFIKHRRSK